MKAPRTIRRRRGMKAVGFYLLDRAKEPSTWLGLGSFSTALGWTLSPEHWVIISQFGMGAGGLAAAFLSDRSL